MQIIKDTSAKSTRQAAVQRELDGLVDTHVAAEYLHAAIYARAQQFLLE